MRKAFLALLGCVALALALTWPLALHLDDSLFGDYGDRRGQVWGAWVDAHGLRSGGTTRLVAAPFGATPIPRLVSQPLYEWPIVALARLWNEIAAVNVLTIAAFAVTAFATFVVLRRLTGRAGPAFFGGLAFGFCPAIVLQAAGGHGEFAWSAFVPLFVLALFHHRAARSWRSALWVGLAFTGIALVSLYMAYFCVYLALAFAVFELATTAPSSWLRVAGSYLACAAFAVLSFVPFHWQAFHALAAGGDVATAVSARNIFELYVFSARPADYLIPSIDHPVLGDWAAGLMRPRLRDNAFEQTLYLGVVPLALTAGGLVAIFARRWRGNQAAMFLFFVGAALWMAIVSLPPRLGPGIPNVSELAYALVPFFRVYARAGILVAFLVACAAALALARFSARGRHGLVAVACALLAFEFWSVPPGYALPVGKPPAVYEWLARQPGDIIVAEYPMVPFDEASHYSFVFWQRVHQKRLVNGAPPRDPEAWAFYQAARELSNPCTPALLLAAGVRYVIVHKRLYAEGPVPYPLKHYYAVHHADMTYDGGIMPPVPDGLRLQAAFGPDLVFVPEATQACTNTPAISRK